MGELAAGVAHEIRNPLAGIAGAIEIISKDFPRTIPTEKSWTTFGRRFGV